MSMAVFFKNRETYFQRATVKFDFELQTALTSLIFQASLPRSLIKALEEMFRVARLVKKGFLR